MKRKLLFGVVTGATFAPGATFLWPPCRQHLVVTSSSQSFLPNDQSPSSIQNKSGMHVQYVQHSENLRVGSAIRRAYPSAFFLALSAALGKLVVDIQQSSLSIEPSMGIVSLFCTTLAVCYDNLIIGLGGLVFRNHKGALKRLSYPRFFFHFVGVPLLYTTALDIGKASGVSSLQGDWIKHFVMVLAVIVSILSTLKFMSSPGIALADTSDWPPNAFGKEQLVWFTYAKQEFLYYIFPSIVLAVWSVLAGIGVALKHSAAGRWLIASAAAVLIGSAPKKHITRFTGNLVEVGMLWCMFRSASLVM